MSLIESIKNKVKEKTGRLAEPGRMTMRVCMLGARGVGKTSLITSLYQGQKDAVKGTRLFLTADVQTGTEAALSNKRYVLDSIFREIHEKGDVMTESGLPGDAAESRFLFTYGMSSERINIDLEIRDYPGEYLKTEPDKVAQYIKEADAVFIAIDTPFMMECGGKYNEGRNMPERVQDFLIKNLSNESNKLVLFVPLKCEKYFINGTIASVTTQVETVYARLIAHLKGQRNDSTSKKNVACAITPIETLGTVEFLSFGADSDGNVEETTDKNGAAVPKKVNYCYAVSNAKYSPKYCEQPLYYLLGFVSKKYKAAMEAKETKGWMFKLQLALRLIPQFDDFKNEMGVLSARKLNGAQGYKILFGQGKI